ncbi:hypothetical protein BST61_g889 [Cercospora zeina]
MKMPLKRKTPAAAASSSTSASAKPLAKRRSKLAKENDITAEEEAEIQEAFALFCSSSSTSSSNTTPTIRTIDIRRCLIALNAPPASNADLQELIDIAVGADGEEGAIDYEHFLPVAALQMNRVKNERDEEEQNKEVHKAFALFTRGEEREITIADLRRVAKELREDVPESVLRDMVREAKGGPLGAVGKEEFENVMRRAGVFGAAGFVLWCLKWATESAFSGYTRVEQTEQDQRKVDSEKQIDSQDHLRFCRKKFTEMSGGMGFSGVTPVGEKRGREDGDLEDGREAKRPRTAEEEEEARTWERFEELFGEVEEGDEEDDAVEKASGKRREDSFFVRGWLLAEEEAEEEEDPLFSGGYSTEELNSLSAEDMFGEDLPKPAEDQTALPTQASQDQAKNGARGLALPTGTPQKQTSGETALPASVDEAAFAPSTIQPESGDQQTSGRSSVSVEGLPPSTDDVVVAPGPVERSPPSTDDVVSVPAPRRKGKGNKKKPEAQAAGVVSQSTIDTSSLFQGRKRRAWELLDPQEGSSSTTSNPFAPPTASEVATPATSLPPVSGEISAPIDLTAPTKRERKALLKQQHEERKAIREREIAEKYAVSLDVASPPSSQEEVNAKYDHIGALRVEAGHEAEAYNDPEGHRMEKKKKKAAKMAEWRSRRRS